MNDHRIGNAGRKNQTAGVDRALDHLYRFAGSISTTAEIDDLLEDSLEPLLTMGAADKVLIALPVKPGSPLTVARHRGWDVPPECELPPDQIAALGRDAIGYNALPDLPEPFRRACAEAKGPVALLPLWGRSELIGLIALVRADKPFDMPTLKMLGTACRQLALALESAKLFTELQSSYRQLVDTQEGLIRSESIAALGGLAATMAHEIRNPLSTIFSAISQVRKHAQLTGDSATLLEIAEEEAVRLNTMVAELLEYAKPQAPKPRKGKPVEVSSQVVAAALENPEHPRGVEIIELSQDRELTCVFDPELFQKALGHLVSNAVGAIEAASGKVCVEVRANPAAPDGMVAEVTDTGCGIPPEIRNSVVEPFFSTKASGVGLGLPVVKRIAEDHGGSLEIDSKPGTGTTVRLLFGQVQQRTDDWPPMPDGETNDEKKSK